MEEAMDQEHLKMRWMLQAIDEGEIEGAMDGASNGSGSNGRYNNLSLIYMSEYDTIKIIIVLHEFKNNNNNGIKKLIASITDWFKVFLTSISSSTISTISVSSIVGVIIPRRSRWMRLDSVIIDASTIGTQMFR